jgi:hypothetical protein
LLLLVVACCCCCCCVVSHQLTVDIPRDGRYPTILVSERALLRPPGFSLGGATRLNVTSSVLRSSGLVGLFALCAAQPAVRGCPLAQPAAVPATKQLGCSFGFHRGWGAAGFRCP